MARQKDPTIRCLIELPILVKVKKAPGGSSLNEDSLVAHRDKREDGEEDSSTVSSPNITLDLHKVRKQVDMFLRREHQEQMMENGISFPEPGGSQVEQ